MKKTFLLSISILLLFMLSFNGDMYARNKSSDSVHIKLRKGSKSDRDNKLNRNEGHRTPGRAIQCSISCIEGVSIEDHDVEVYSYEIWDTDGETCQFATSDEPDFVNTLFTMEGEYQVQFNSNDYIYVGYVEL